MAFKVSDNPKSQKSERIKKRRCGDQVCHWGYKTAPFIRCCTKLHLQHFKKAHRALKLQYTLETFNCSGRHFPKCPFKNLPGFLYSARGDENKDCNAIKPAT